jgi:hypothetical protein
MVRVQHSLRWRAAALSIPQGQSFRAFAVGLLLVAFSHFARAQTEIEQPTGPQPRANRGRRQGWAGRDVPVGGPTTQNAAPGSEPKAALCKNGPLFAYFAMR